MDDRQVYVTPKFFFYLIVPSVAIIFSIWVNF